MAPVPQLSLHKATLGLPAICPVRRSRGGESTENICPSLTMPYCMTMCRVVQSACSNQCTSHRNVGYACGLRYNVAPGQATVTDDHVPGRQVAQRAVIAERAAPGDSVAAAHLPVRHEGAHSSQDPSSLLSNAHRGGSITGRLHAESISRVCCSFNRRGWRRRCWRPARRPSWQPRPSRSR